jgi:hypothetical protein
MTWGKVWRFGHRFARVLRLLNPTPNHLATMSKNTVSKKKTPSKAEVILRALAYK